MISIRMYDGSGERRGEVSPGLSRPAETRDVQLSDEAIAAMDEGF